MDKKTIQEKRKRGYFIEAAKKIIREEGTQKLTVKKVADRAGFAPGTLYNYFSDLNALYGYCVADFWKECEEEVINNISKEENSVEKIIKACKAYVSYFFDNPNVFKLIFLEDFKNVPEEIKKGVYDPEVVKLLGKYLKEASQSESIKSQNEEQVESIIANYLHGILLFYIMDRAVESREQIQIDLKNNIEFILHAS